MNSPLVVNNDHTIKSWSIGHRQLFFPGFANSRGQKQAAAFVAAPVSGSVPETEAGANAKLPENGVLLQVLAPRWQHETSHVENGEQHDFRTTLGGTEKLPWQCEVLVHYSYNKSTHILVTEVHIERSSGCEVSGPMPAWLGFHLCLATHGENALIVPAGRGFRTGDILVGSRRLLDAHQVLSFLSRTGYELEFNTDGFDSYEITSDDPSQYVCIAAVKGIKKPLQLQPGDKHMATCTVKYHP